MDSDRVQAGRKRLQKYGAPCDDLQVLLEAQGHRCAICQQPEGDRVLVIDHDHETGLYRGLLCSNCNVGIGNLHDNPTKLAAAIVYVLRARGLCVDHDALMAVVDSAVPVDQLPFAAIS